MKSHKLNKADEIRDLQLFSLRVLALYCLSFVRLLGSLFVIFALGSVASAGQASGADSSAREGQGQRAPIELRSVVREPSSASKPGGMVRPAGDRRFQDQVYTKFAEMCRARLTIKEAFAQVSKGWPTEISGPLWAHIKDVGDAKLPELTSRSRPGRVEMRWPPYVFRVEIHPTQDYITINDRRVAVDGERLPESFAAISAEVEKIFSSRADRSRSRGDEILSQAMYSTALADGGAMTGALAVGAWIAFFWAWDKHDSACSTTETLLGQCTQSLEELGHMRQRFLALLAENDRNRVVDMNGRSGRGSNGETLEKICPTEEQNETLDDIVALPTFRALRLDQDRHRTGFFARFGYCEARRKLTDCLVQSVSLARGLCLDVEPTGGRLSRGAPGVRETGPRPGIDGVVRPSRGQPAPVSR